MWVPVLHSQVAAEATALAEKEAKVVEELSTTNIDLYDDLSWYCAWVSVFFFLHRFDCLHVDNRQQLKTRLLWERGQRFWRCF